MKRHSGLSGDCRGGKLAHIRLIRGPQSPLTFASQSQVARCLCYRLDYVSSALSRFVQIVLKAEHEGGQISAPGTAAASTTATFILFFRVIVDLGDSSLVKKENPQHKVKLLFVCEAFRLAFVMPLDDMLQKGVTECKASSCESEMTSHNN